MTDFTNLTRFVNVIFDAVTKTFAFQGDCDAMGRVHVGMGAPTDIWLLLWTINIPVTEPPIAPAIIYAVLWPPSGQPYYIASQGTEGLLPPGQTNPQWMFTDNYLDQDETGVISYHLVISFNGQYYGDDPTIINVDPPSMAGRQAPRREAPAGSPRDGGRARPAGRAARGRRAAGRTRGA